MRTKTVNYYDFLFVFSLEEVQKSKQQVVAENVQLEQKLSEEQSRREMLQEELYQTQEQLKIQADVSKIQEVNIVQTRYL